MKTNKFDRLEPDLEPTLDNPNGAYLQSIAISLKRLADVFYRADVVFDPSPIRMTRETDVASISDGLLRALRLITEDWNAAQALAGGGEFTIAKLLDGGLVEKRTIGEPPRPQYRLTDRGRAVIHAERQRP